PASPSLAENLTCDTVIVGSGIAGLSVAYELTRSGHAVIVLDRGPIAGGITSRTTAHLAPVCDDGIDELIKARGDETARLFQESQAAAVDRIEAIVASEAISCGFRRLDGYLFPAMGMSRSDGKAQRDRQYEAARKAQVAAERATGVPLKGFEDAPVVRYPRQATFHPLKYLEGLVAAIKDRGGRLFADTAVTDVAEQDNGVTVTTAKGKTVKARQVVLATNSPIKDNPAIHDNMAPYRTYAMAFTIPRGTLPDALYWDMADPYHYVRLHPGTGTTDYLIVGGADHKSGEGDDGDVRFEAVEAWTRQLVPDLGREVHRWSGQVLDTPDYCGFIGRDPGSDKIYVVTGDSGQGMTHGALSGLLLRDLIVSGASPWDKVYDPARKISTGVLNYVSENVSALKSLATHAAPGDLESTDELGPGQGGIMHRGGSKIAACRDLGGKLHMLDAACTHRGCEVQWNSTEQCWDCPCHGSHFAPDGAVLNAPAISPLGKASS
ncbi:MAG TPA: FAD-dependent oxidoreductase, partial [Beijerinckiaceae bacterium]|nr:FAD-dependent oxidoreductase [Beijerinckiaceae bacterium]